MAGRGSKDKEEYERIYAQGEAGGVYRPEDHIEEGDEGYMLREEDAGPAWEMVEGQTVEVDLDLVRTVPVRFQGQGDRSGSGTGETLIGEEGGGRF